jgi:hypothetical protein
MAISVKAMVVFNMENVMPNAHAKVSTICVMFQAMTTVSGVT